MQHLPDLPNAGYATTRAKLLSDQIQEFMRGTERNRLLLIRIVLGGPETFRRNGKDALGSWAPTELLDSIYEYFRLQAADGTPYQQQLLENLQNPVKTREILRALWPLLEKQKDQLELMETWSPVQRAGWHG